MKSPKYPIGLPHSDPVESYWQTPPSSLADHRTTPVLPRSVRYAIIGSGITGALIAYKLLLATPNATILLLEARTACSGATGRNGGHCRAARYPRFTRDRDLYGLSEALKLEQIEHDNVQSVDRIVKTESIDCDWKAVETVDVWTEPRGFAEAAHAVKVRKSLDENALEGLRKWTSGECREKLLISDAVGAFSWPAFQVQPYALVCGILEKCLQRGLNLQTHTPVLSVTNLYPASGTKWKISTATRGAVVADTVILATNAYTGALFPPLREFIIPTRGQLVAVRPGTKIEGAPVLTKTLGLESSTTGDYMQIRAPGTAGEGDCIIGGGRSFAQNSHDHFTSEQPVFDDSRINPLVAEHLRHTATDFFGADNWGEEGRVLKEWTGIMGYTLDGQPIVGEAPGKENEGLWLCVGFHGHGMPRTERAAEAVTQLVLGESREDVGQWLPECWKIERTLA